MAKKKINAAQQALEKQRRQGLGLSSDFSALAIRNSHEENRPGPSIRELKDRIEQLKEQKDELRKKLFNESTVSGNLRLELEESNMKLANEKGKSGNLEAIIADLRHQSWEQTGKVRELTSENARLQESLSSTQKSLNLETQEKFRLQSHWNSATAENANLKSQLEHAQNAAYSRQQNQNDNRNNKLRLLQQKYEDVLDKLRDTEEDIERLENDAENDQLEQDKLNSEVSRMKKVLAIGRTRYELQSQSFRASQRQVQKHQNIISKLESLLAASKTTVHTYSLSLKASQDKVLELESDRDLKAPLVEIGVKIRMRFLEKRRAENCGWGKELLGDIEPTIITNGNHAAHRASPVADAVMLVHGLIPEEHREHVQESFLHVYNKSSQLVLNCQHRFHHLRFWNCQVNVPSNEKLKKSRDFLKLNADVDKWIETEYKLCAIVNDRDLGDKEVASLLNTFEELTERLMDQVRPGGNGRR